MSSFVCRPPVALLAHLLLGLIQPSCSAARLSHLLPSNVQQRFDFFSSLSYSLACLLSHFISLPHSLTPSLPHSLTHSLTPSITESNGSVLSTRVHLLDSMKYGHMWREFIWSLHLTQWALLLLPIAYFSKGQNRVVNSPYSMFWKLCASVMVCVFILCRTYCFHEWVEKW